MEGFHPSEEAAHPQGQAVYRNPPDYGSFPAALPGGGVLMAPGANDFFINFMQFAVHLPKGGGSFVTYRVETSWPVRHAIHTLFPDHFPALAQLLASPHRDEAGFFHYVFGVCDFDTEERSMAAVTLLKSICSEMATASTEALLVRLRPKLEEHMMYWQRNVPKQLPPMGYADQAVAPPLGRPAVAQGGAAANGFKTGRWTDDEHATFLDLLKVHGKSWTAIARAMPHRSEPRSRRASVSLVIRASPKRSSPAPPAQANPLPRPEALQEAREGD